MKTDKKILISLFDHSGNASKPYKNDPNWLVLQIDIKNGIDILTWEYQSEIAKIDDKYNITKVGIIAAIPCTDYALSGARHFKAKDLDGRTAKSQLIVSKTYDIITHVRGNYGLEFWYVENPMSRIHTLNPWLGRPLFKFNPCDFAGYSDNAENDRYNKQTWLWGKFNVPDKRRLEPLQKEYPGWKLYGGKSEKIKELRSITPMGFCNAFYLFNR